MTRFFAAGVVVLVMFAGSTRLHAIDVGDTAPSINAESWLNLPSGVKSVAPEHLKGRVVVAVFVQAASPESKESIPQLSELKKQYESKGVFVLALFTDPRAKVASLVEKTRIECVVGCGARETFDEFGISNVPFAVVIGSDGKVAWTGHPAVVDSEIGKALKATPPKKKGSPFSEAAATVLKKADKLYREGKFADAMDLFTQVTAEHKGSTQAKKANEQIKKMKGNSTIMEALRRADAGKKCGKWLACARVLAQNGEKADAAKYYDRIINEFGEFEQAKIARAERKALAYEGKTEAAKPSKAAARKAADDDEDEDDDSEDDEDSDDDDEDDDGDEEDDEDDGE